MNTVWPDDAEETRAGPWRRESLLTEELQVETGLHYGRTAGLRPRILFRPKCTRGCYFNMLFKDRPLRPCPAVQTHDTCTTHPPEASLCSGPHRSRSQTQAPLLAPKHLPYLCRGSNRLHLFRKCKKKKEKNSKRQQNHRPRPRKVKRSSF